MTNNDSLEWKIDKIEDCDGYNMMDESYDNPWVEVNPIGGYGDTNAKISITPSENWNDCNEAIITVLTSKGNKKHITVNRCNPECNCDSVVFTPVQTITPFDAKGETKQIATYSMKYNCSPDKINIVNTGDNCEYMVSNGIISAIVGENSSYTNGRYFSYYLTYDGEKCYSGSFEQNRSINPCESETSCPTAYPLTYSLSYSETEIDFQIEDFSDCWDLEISEYGGNDFEITYTSDTLVTLYIGKNEETTEREFIFTFQFKNNYSDKMCVIDTDKIVQSKKPSPVVYCQTCEDVNPGIVNSIEIHATPLMVVNTLIATMDVDCKPSKVWFTHKSGDYIISRENVSKIFADGELNIFAQAGTLTKNDNTNERRQIINMHVGDDEAPVCGDDIVLIQKGVEEPPPVVETCGVVFGSTSDIEIGCNDVTKRTVVSFKAKYTGNCETYPTVIVKVKNTIGDTIVASGSTTIRENEETIYGVNLNTGLSTGNYNIYINDVNNQSSIYKPNIRIDSCDEEKVEQQLRLTVSAVKDDYDGGPRNVYFKNLSLMFNVEKEGVPNSRKNFEVYGHIPVSERTCSSLTNAFLCVVKSSCASSEKNAKYWLSEKSFYTDIVMNFNEQNLIDTYDTFIIKASSLDFKVSKENQLMTCDNDYNYVVNKGSCNLTIQGYQTIRGMNENNEFRIKPSNYGKSMSEFISGINNIFIEFKAEKEQQS